MFLESLLNAKYDTISQDFKLISSAQKILSQREKLKLDLTRSLTAICEEAAMELCEQQKYQEASKEFKKICLTTQEDNHKGLFLYVQAMILQDAGRYNESILKNFVALKFVQDESIKDKIRCELIKSLGLEAIELAKQNQFEQASISIVAAMKLKFKDDEKVGMVDFFENLGRLAIFNGRFDLAIQKYIAVYQITNDPKYKANIIFCRGCEVIANVPTTGLCWIALASTICDPDYIDKKIFIEYYKEVSGDLCIGSEIKIAEIMSIDREKIIQKSGKDLYKFLDIGEINVDEEILIFENVDITKIQESLEKEHPLDITPLHIAAFWGQIDEVKKILEKQEMDVNKQTIGGDTALHLSVIEGYPEIVELLLKCSKIDIELTSDDSYTALDLSIINNRLDILELFANHGANLKKQYYLDLAFESKSYGTILLFYSLGLSLDLTSRGCQNTCTLVSEIEDIYNSSPNIYKVTGGIRLLNDLEKLPLLPGVPFAVKFLMIELHSTIANFMQDIQKYLVTKIKSSIILDLEKHLSNISYLDEACRELLTESDEETMQNTVDINLKDIPSSPPICKSFFEDDCDRRQLLEDIKKLPDHLDKFQDQLSEESLLNTILDGMSSIDISGESCMG